VCLAKLAGVAGSQRDIARFAKRLNQTQRRQLSCYRNPKTDLREAPSQSTFFRALKAVSYDALEPLLVGWQDDLLGPADPKELVVLDGKAARAAGGQMVISAVSVPSGRVLGVKVVRTKDELQPDDRPQGTSEAAVAPAPLAVQPAPQAPKPAQVQTAANPSAKPKKENEIPAARRLLARIPITGRLVSLDAMHTQHQTAGQIVLDAGADYLLTLKDNQPTLTQTAQTLIPSAFFPSGSRGDRKTHSPNGGEES
jgi:hypothetical protein